MMSSELHLQRLRLFRHLVVFYVKAHVTACYICVCACKSHTMGPVHRRHYKQHKTRKTSAQQQLTQWTAWPRARYLPPTGQPEPFCVLWPSAGASLGAKRGEKPLWAISKNFILLNENHIDKNVT